MTALRLPTPGADDDTWSGDPTHGLNPWLLADHNADGTHMDLLNAKSAGYGAKGDGSTNDTAAVQACINDAQAAGLTAYLPEGNYSVTDLAILGRCALEGAGSDKTVLTARAATSVAAIYAHPSATTSSLQIRGLTIQMAAAAAADGIKLDNVTSLSSVDDVNIQGGTNGVTLSNTGASYFHRILCRNQTNNCINVLGDGCGELYFDNIDLGRNTTGTTVAGFAISRTTATDTGAYYLDGVRITCTGGTMTNGFKFSASGSPAVLPVLLTNCVADAINGTGNAMLVDNVNLVRAMNSWFTTQNTNYAVRYNGGQDHMLFGNWTDGGASFGSFDFANATLNVHAIANACNQGVAFNIPASSPPTVLFLSENRVSTLTNDAARLRAARQGSDPFCLTASKAWDPASCPDGSSVQTTVTVTGALQGDPVTVGYTSLTGQACQISGTVSATNTVTVTLFNNSGGALDFASGTLRADVWVH